MRYNYERFFSGPTQAALNAILLKEMDNLIAYRPQLRKQLTKCESDGQVIFKFNTWEVAFWKVDMRAASEAPNINFRKGLTINVKHGKIVFSGEDDRR